MLFKTTIKLFDSKFDIIVDAVSSNSGGDALFVTTTDQPIGSEKAMKMKKIEEAAVMSKIGKKFFDEEMLEAGINPTKDSRVQYRLKEEEWLKTTVFANVKEIFIRRWFDKYNGNSYYSLRLVASLDNSTYILHVPMRHGYGSSNSLLRQAGITPKGILVSKWLEQHNIEVVDEGYGRMVNMYKSAL